MNKWLLSFITIFNIFLCDAFHNDVCEKCVRTDSCPQFNNMHRDEQQRWIRQFPCQQTDDDQSSSVYGFAPVARGDYVCCPGLNVWSIVNDESERVTRSPYEHNYDQSGLFNIGPWEQQRKTENIPPYGSQNYNPYQKQNFGYQQRPGGRRIDDANNNLNFGNWYPNYENSNQHGVKNQNFNKDPNIRQHGQHKNYPKQNFPTPNNPQFFIPNSANQYPPCSNNQFLINGQPNPNCNSYHYQPTQRTPVPSTQIPRRKTPPPRPIQNVYPVFTTNPKTINGQPPNSNGLAVGNDMNNQCKSFSSLPPDPDSECCGLDMSGSGEIIDLQNTVSQRIRNSLHNQNNIRMKRQVENSTVGIDLDNRIAGGSETQLNQFPWTVLLKITFDYGNNKTTFNCGGSIISFRYILTAAHCVYEKGARLSELEIYMAEYDKRTFPKDCKLGYDGEKTCIDNVKMYAEDVIHHPEYNDQKLYNDIALIRLRGVAPYTEFIRPICLTPINVDTQAFSGLPLPVAGWGRNGPYVSNVKQSAVVNLVPHTECKKHYPYLSSSHLCAAGKTGEDTCKGDSGGPLMMLYGGKYYVVGVVSGKRADTPCGTSVPSLYTNVFEYLQWIRSNIK